jgi:hypothetical protein
MIRRANTVVQFTKSSSYNSLALWAGVCLLAAPTAFSAAPLARLTTFGTMGKQLSVLSHEHETELFPGSPEHPDFWWIIRGTDNLPVELGGLAPDFVPIGICCLQAQARAGLLQADAGQLDPTALFRDWEPGAQAGAEPGQKDHPFRLKH